MPLIDVTYDDTLTDAVLRHLARLLPDVVADAVACPEEPWLGAPAQGDIEIRFHQRGLHDVGDLNCVVEVRTKIFDSRVHDKHARASRIRDAIVAAEIGVGDFGVWLILLEGSWSQA